MVPKEGVEPTHLLKVLRPERSASTISPLRLSYLLDMRMWWAVEDLNLGPLACEASALTTELTAPRENMMIIFSSTNFIVNINGVFTTELMFYQIYLPY